MVTRGEGGGNAVGQEIGPALGLRRENEDRVAHYRSGTVDIFNLDRSTSSTTRARRETQFFWGHDETLRPRHADHPHDAAGRLHRLHADARRRPRQPPAGRPHDLGGHATPRPTRRCSPTSCTGPHALSTWQVKKVFSGGSTAGTGGTTTAADCTTGFVPTPGTNLDTVAGVWTGYDSPYLWPAGNVQGQPAGHAEDLGAGRGRGRAPPTRRRAA